MPKELAGYAQDDQGWYMYTSGAVGKLLGRFDTQEEAHAAAEEYNGRPFNFDDGVGV